MRKHVYTIVSCILVALTIFILEIIAYKKGDFYLSIGYVLQTIFFVIWVGFAPLAYYTFFRLINEKDLENFKFYNLAISCDSIIGILFIPIFLSPILLLDYIKFLKCDYKKKNNIFLEKE